MTADLTRLATETIEDHAVNAHPDDDLAQDTFDGRMLYREPLLAAGVLDLARQLAEARAEIEGLRKRPSPQHDPGAHVIMRETIEFLRKERDASLMWHDEDRQSRALYAANLRDAFEWQWPQLWLDDPEFVPFEHRIPTMFDGVRNYRDGRGK
jgi:hypothetical protein